MEFGASLWIMYWIMLVDMVSVAALDTGKLEINSSANKVYRIVAPELYNYNFFLPQDFRKAEANHV